MVPMPVEFYRQACPLFPLQNVQEANVHGSSLIIHTWKKCNRSPTESTKNKQSNPESHGVFFFLLVQLISEKENKQGLDAIDASVSKRVCLHCGDEGH